jgi:hypothetical protein
VAENIASNTAAAANQRHQRYQRHQAAKSRGGVAWRGARKISAAIAAACGKMACSGSASRGGENGIAHRRLGSAAAAAIWR